MTAKGGTDANAASKLKNLKISAAGNATANGFADGDSGGITAWGAAATITMSTKTTNTASLSGAWDVAENADIGSLQQVTSRGTSKGHQRHMGQLRRHGGDEYQNGAERRDPA